MATKLTRLTHKIAIKLHLVAESSTNCSPRSRRPVQKLLDKPSCVCVRTKFEPRYSTHPQRGSHEAPHADKLSDGVHCMAALSPCWRTQEA
jgi:hypothetical protein